MSSDPNGTRWSTSENNVGKNILKKSGWQEGSGLGKDQDGITSHVKVSRKDDMMGIGYKAGVAEAWSTQSVGFADVLDRIKSKVVVNDSDSDGEGGEPSPSASSPTDSSRPSSPTESRHYRMYAKRNALKTELLRAENREKKEEILGSAARGRRGGDAEDSAEDSDNGGQGSGTRKRSRAADEAGTTSTLQSPLLGRLMVRCPKHEPRPTVAKDGGKAEERVHLTKPNPRPPKCTETPFLLE